jgi:glycosyltransferase involved in cell wall biosynthesis
LALRKDKITVALLWPKYSGKVTSVNDLVLGLNKERFSIIFIYLNRYDINKNHIEEAGYEVYYLSNRERISTFRLSILLRLVKILKKHSVDILHCHRHKSTVYGVMAAFIAKTPVVIAQVHGLGRSRNFRRRLINFLVFKKLNRIVTVANSVKEDVLKNNWSLAAEKLFILVNSVDYERFSNLSISKKDAKRMLGLPSNVFIFGTIGRLAPTKGLLYLIEAFAKVKEQKPSAHLVLLGNGQCREELERHASNVSCSDSIHFLGYRDNVEQLLRGMDIFVLSSIAEGMPRAILEAMAAGVPCIATEVGGIPEIINNKNIGFLVPARDSASLARSMIAVAKMPKNNIAKLVKNAQHEVKQVYSHNIVREKLKNLYENEFKKASIVFDESTYAKS